MALQTVQATLNGQTYTLTLNEETGKYEAQVTAPELSSFNQEGHYYGMTVSATDDAGNETTVDTSDSAFGENLKLVVKETVAPVITVTSPTADQTLTNNQPVITFTVTDNDSGVNADTITVVIDGTEYTADITKTAITNGYSCEFTVPVAFTDGDHTVQVKASDNDENEGASEVISITVDCTPPELSVSSPANGLVTNKETVTVIGTTNDVTSSPVTLTINGEAVTVSSDGSFTHAVTLTKGINTITVVATDSVGKVSTVTRTVTYNTAAPVISGITITPNPVSAGGVFTISVTVTDE